MKRYKNTATKFREFMIVALLIMLAICLIFAFISLSFVLFLSIFNFINIAICDVVFNSGNVVMAILSTFMAVIALIAYIITKINED